MAAWALYDLSGFVAQTLLVPQQSSSLHLSQRGREVLVSNLHSYSRALHLILQFCIKFEIAGWCSLGAASKSRNTLQNSLHIFLSFHYFFLTLSQSVSVLGEILGHIRLQLQEAEEMHDVISCVPSHALEMPSDLLNIQCIFSVSTDCVG